MWHLTLLKPDGNTVPHTLIIGDSAFAHNVYLRISHDYYYFLKRR